MDDVLADDRTLAPPAAAPVDRQSVTSPPVLWILTGNRVGDNNQLFALANALGLPYEAKQLTYNRLRRISLLRGPRLMHLTRQALRILRPPWPELVIGLGYESLPVARYIRHQSRGRARLVQIGNPRAAIDDLDLVITTPQYCLTEAPNVLALPFPIGNPAGAVDATKQEVQWLRALPRPRRLIAVGGSTRQWKIDNSELDRAVRQIQSLCASDGGSAIAVTSRRTTPQTARLLKARLTGGSDACVEDFPRFAVLLAWCDEFYVTADSVSMLSEAILTGKPVGMIPITRSLRGNVGHWIRRCGWNLPSQADLQRFWESLYARQIIGSVDRPVASNVSDSVSVAANAVLNLLRPAPSP
jgi:mitochondrial fission protein ELM1